MHQPVSSRLAQYTLTLLAVAAVVLVRRSFDPWLGEVPPLTTVYAAVAFAVWLGGWRMALLAAVTGFVACEIFFVEPHGPLGLLDKAGLFAVGTFIVTSALIGGFGEAMRRARSASANLAEDAISSETRLRESEERLRQAKTDLEFQKYALDQSSIVAITDVDGTITYVNDKFCEISGYSREELIGQNHRIINSDLHSREFFRDMYLSISQGRVWRGEIRNRRKDGTFYWVDTTIVPSIGPQGKLDRYVAIRNDITERKQVETNLAFQKYALDQSSIVAITDVHGTITYVNDKFCEISGYSREELIGQNHRIINSSLHPREFFRNMYLTIAHGEVWHGEIRNRRKNGSYYWVDTTIVPSIGPDGKPERYVAIRNDITERKQAEEALAQHAESLAQAVRKATSELEQVHERQRSAERLVAMGTLAAGLGHDLGNLLLPMDARLEGLKHEPLSAKATDDLRAIAASVEYLRNAVRGLRNLSMDATGHGSGELVTDLIQWWPQTMPILKASLPRGVRLETDILGANEGEDLIVSASPHQITQIVFNLVQNAGEALSKAQVQGGLVKVSANRHNGRVCISVRDNGPGMSDDVKRRCLEPFFTTKKKALGGGMGLSLIASIIERLKGEIQVDSTLAEGTTFRVLLPAAAQRSGEAASMFVTPMRIAAISVNHARLRGLIEWTLRAHRVAVFDIGKPGERVTANLWIAEPPHDHAALRFAQDEKCCVVIIDDPPAGRDHNGSNVLYTGRSPSPLVLREVLNRALATIPEQEQPRGCLVQTN